MSTSGDDTMTLFHRSGDADPHALDGQRMSVIGYGNLGASLAANLRDSGLDVVIGNVDDDYRGLAESDGFRVLPIAEAVEEGDVVHLLLPDEVLADRFDADIAPAVRPGSALCLASGYCLAFDLLQPPDDVDVLLLAPRMLGEEVRRSYLDGTGFFSYVSVEQDATGKADARLLALADAAGSLRRGAMRLSARDEARLDLLIEQTVGPYIGTAIQLAFAAGTEAGLPPEAMVLEMYVSGEMSRTFQTFAEAGFYKSVTWHGAVAQFGGYLRTLDIDHDAMARQFAATLEDISNGGFARRLQEEHGAGYPTLESISGITAGNDPLSQAEDRVREAIDG